MHAPSTRNDEASSGAGQASYNATSSGKNQKSKASGGAAAGAPNWRLGQFHDDNDDNQYHTENTAAMASQSMADGLVIEEKKMSKHAARRARKRAKAGAVVEPSEDPGIIGADSGSMSTGQGKKGKQQQIMGDTEPSLDDL